MDAATLSKLHEVARVHQEKYKAITKEAYDCGAKERSFRVGDIVLLHTPNLSSTLESIWEGPYEVITALSSTSYPFAVPNQWQIQNFQKRGANFGASVHNVNLEASIN